MCVIAHTTRTHCFAPCKENKKEHTFFVSNALRVPKEYRLLEGSQNCPVCPTGKSNQWNDVYRGEPKYWEKKTCPNAISSTTNLTRTWDRTRGPRKQRLSYSMALQATHSSPLPKQKILSYPMLPDFRWYCFLEGYQYN